MTEDKVESISCVTRNSNPAPVISWMLGNWILNIFKPKKKNFEPKKNFQIQKKIFEPKKIVKPIEIVVEFF